MIDICSHIYWQIEFSLLEYFCPSRARRCFNGRRLALPEKGGDAMVTYSELFAYSMVLIAFATLITQICKRKWPPSLTNWRSFLDISFRLTACRSAFLYFYYSQISLFVNNTHLLILKWLRNYSQSIFYFLFILLSVIIDFIIPISV